MLSIIIPTYNERKNLEELCERIDRAIPENREIIIVDDDSQDGTVELAKQIAEKYSIIILSRPAKIGLSSAVIAGFKLAKGEIMAVMDADLQHPPEVLPKMLERIEKGYADFVIGSRLVKGGGSKDWPWYRRFVSFAARLPAMPLTKVKDLTSGLFMVKREVIEGVKLNPIGFKLCLEIICKGKHNKVEEYPIIFGERRGGKSKMGSQQIFEYLLQLKDLYQFQTSKIKIQNKS